MLETILVLLYGAITLLFGTFLSIALCGIRITRKNTLLCLGLCSFCGILQITIYLTASETTIWKLYPVITHVPLILFLRFVYHKRWITSFTAIFTAYLLCQPAKWFSVLTLYITQNDVLEILVRICITLLVAIIAVPVFSPYLAEIYNKDTRSVLIFGIVPGVYYLFDYTTVIYTDLWTRNNRVTAEFLPFFLCIIFMCFCLIYYKEYEQKADAQRKEQIIRITAEQQTKELATIKRSEQEIRLLRHDMRHFLKNLSVCLEDDTEKAKAMITAYSSLIDGTKIEHFCKIDTINYVLSDFNTKCKANQVSFHWTVELTDFIIDEILFSSILSNALDNALNAQKYLAPSERHIKLLLKITEGKLLLSIKNTIKKEPVFIDGLPISTQKGHGYGTQSIRYTTERLGGKCQFSVQDNQFILRVIL